MTPTPTDPVHEPDAPRARDDQPAPLPPRERSPWRLLGISTGVLLVLIGAVLGLGWFLELGFEAAAPRTGDAGLGHETRQVLLALAALGAGAALIAIFRPRRRGA